MIALVAVAFFATAHGALEQDANVGTNNELASTPSGTVHALVSNAPAAKFIPIQFLAKLPPVSPEEQKRREEMLNKPHIRGLRLPKDNTPVGPSGGATTIIANFNNVNLQSYPQGNFILFKNSSIGTAAPVGWKSNVQEPSLANSGDYVFYTGNWYAARSTDGGSSFSYIDPFVDMPTFCCDQDVIYDKNHDIFIWYRQGDENASAVNFFRLGISNDKGANWFFYDFYPTDINSTWTNQYWDFPQLALSNNYLYITSNMLSATANTRTVLLRFPLDTLANHTTGFSFFYLPWTDEKLTFIPVQGATSTMYWGIHKNNSVFRLFSLDENSTSPDWYLKTIPSWNMTNGDANCPGPDGNNWCARADSRFGAVGWVANGTIGFFWNAKQGGGFPFPYVEAATFRESDKSYVGRPYIWNSSFAFQYPSASPNMRGDLGIGVFWGGGNYYPNHAVGIDDDVSSAPPPWELVTTNIGTDGPIDFRWGDYIRVRPFYPYNLLWIASGYTLQGGSSRDFTDPHYIIFGRAKSRTYTTDADFDKGVLVGLEHDTVHDQLQLSNISTAFPFIWVPNTNEGTISKVDTVTGNEVGRYRVTPTGLPGGGSPSRTTVDLMGNVWVGNRQAGTVVKVGLSEAGQCIDRNGDGTIETSLDTNGDGNITVIEILPWGQDECVLYEVVLIPGHEGTFTPGNYSGPYDTNYWGVAPRGLAIDAANNLWAGTSTTYKYFYIDGATGQIKKTVDVSPWSSGTNGAYGAAIDKNGILWSAMLSSGVLRINTSNLSDIRRINIGGTYGIGLDFLGHLFDGGGNLLTKVDTNDVPNPIIWTKSARAIRGVVATSDNNVWVAGTDQFGNYNAVSRYDNDGNLVTTITGFNAPSGVAVDAAGKVWVTDISSEYIHRINTSTNTIDLSKRIIGSGGHYTYSDMTGFVARGITTTIGTWTVIYDSGSAGTEWGRVSWNGSVPAGGSITVKVRTAETTAGLQLAAYQPVNNGIDFSATGRYIQIETTLKASPAKESPILYDLTVEPAGPASISGMKFDDANGNGIKDAGESGLQGIDIRLIRMIAPGVESLAGSTFTDINGNYSFRGLQPGFYKIEENLSGFARSQTFPANGSPHFINFTGTPIEGVDFGNQPVAGGEIRGTKFNDSNANGVRDAGESGIAGITICLWPSPRCTATDSSGNYTFADVPPSTQTVYEIVPSGNTSTTPTMDSVTVNTGEVKTVDFGNRNLIPPSSDVIVPGAIMENGVPEVFTVNPLAIRKDLSGIAGTIVSVKLTLMWGDGTIKTANMAKLSGTNVWEAIFSPPFPSGTAQMTFEVDVAPAGLGPEDVIQIGDIIFIDPSGQIRSTCTNTPINGANVTLLVEYPPTTGNFIVSPPENQIPSTNPQTTRADGIYGWLTLPGTYKVRAEKIGYSTTESPPVTVPPPASNLNIGLNPIEGCAPIPIPTGNVTGGGWIMSQVKSPKNNNKANFGFVAHYADGATTPSGDLQYDDKAAGLKVHGNVTTLNVNKSTNTAIFTGFAEITNATITINGTYTVTAVDNGEPGKNDMFNITLSTGYTVGGKLGGGNIQIHDK